MRIVKRWKDYLKIVTQIKNPPHWLASICYVLASNFLPLSWAAVLAPASSSRGRIFRRAGETHFQLIFKKNHFWCPNFLMLWRPLSWFLHQILFFISIVVYLPALALEQVTQYQFFRLEEVGYGIWNNLKHMFRHICLLLWPHVCQKCGRGQLGPILCICICFCIHVCICILILCQKGDRGQLGLGLCHHLRRLRLLHHSGWKWSCTL